MSEIKVNSIKGVGASAAAFTVNNSDGTCTANITNNLSNRNKIINGAMSVHQRGTSSTGITGSGYYTADRMQLVLANGGTWTNTISTDTPDGFAASYKLDCTTADASLGAGDLVLFRQIIEGHNLQDFAKGTSSAKQFTVSFYVKTNKTGTYVCELLDDTNSRIVAKSYTVSDTNWNRYTVTFPADTSGTIADSNVAGLYVHFWLAAGTNFTSGTQQTSWATNTVANRVAGLNVNIADSTSNEWYITGIQLEVGSVATDFEHRSFGQELALCQRYFYQATIIGSTSEVSNKPICVGTMFSSSDMRAIIDFPVEMRAEPTLSSNDNSNSYYIQRSGGADFFDRLDAYAITKKRATVRNTSHVNGTGGQAGIVAQETGDSNLSFSAEL